MPRIPTRTEPYDSPTRRQRHYRAKRDQTLRALGKASYVNGSHFAILLINSRGDVETYASEALQSLLSVWFDEEAKSQARAALAIAQENENRRRQAAGGQLIVDGLNDDLMDGADDVMDDGFEDLDSHVETPGPSTFHNDFSASQEGTSQDFSPIAHPAPNQKGLLQPPSFITAEAQPVIPVYNSRFQSRRPPPLSKRTLSQQTITNIIPAWQMEGHRLPRAALPPLPPQPFINPVSHENYPTPPHSAPATVTTHSSVVGDPGDPKIMALFPPFSETLYYRQFHNLQQKVCKLIAKCWIKAIEPKKNFRFPYQGGEQARPDWWPQSLMHKEPDHMLKHQRNLLLITLLRMRLVAVSVLEISTVEIISSISQDKLAILRTVYEMAKIDTQREEDAGLPPSQAPRDANHPGGPFDEFQQDDEPSPEQIPMLPSDNFAMNMQHSQIPADLSAILANASSMLESNPSFAFPAGSMDQLAELTSLLNSNILSSSQNRDNGGMSQPVSNMDHDCGTLPTESCDIWSSIDSLLQGNKNAALDLALPQTLHPPPELMTSMFSGILSAPPNLTTFADRYGPGFKEDVAGMSSTPVVSTHDTPRHQTFDMPVSIPVSVGVGPDAAGLATDLLSWSHLTLPYLHDLQPVKTEPEDSGMPHETVGEMNSFSTIATEDEHPTPSPQKEEEKLLPGWTPASPDTPLLGFGKTTENGAPSSQVDFNLDAEEDQLALEYAPRCLFPASPAVA
ncbi:hypothetical protein FRC03_002523 [Tulasnella sp. 419]|nr:hypothetical protein FRC03_002523 [Tulasnella sp. 419]